MKLRVRAALAILLPISAYAATREVLVGTTPTRIPRTASTVAVEVFNAGPTAIYCAQAPDAGFSDSRPIAPGTSWSLDVTTNQPITCLSTAAQVADAGTRITEIF
jgi:hypothetical protein